MFGTLPPDAGAPENLKAEIVIDISNSTAIRTCEADILSISSGQSHNSVGNAVILLLNLTRTIQSTTEFITWIEAR